MPVSSGHPRAAHPRVPPQPLEYPVGLHRETADSSWMTPMTPQAAWAWVRNSADSRSCPSGRPHVRREPTGNSDDRHLPGAEIDCTAPAAATVNPPPVHHPAPARTSDTRTPRHSRWHPRPFRGKSIGQLVEGQGQDAADHRDEHATPRSDREGSALNGDTSCTMTRSRYPTSSRPLLDAVVQHKYPAAGGYTGSRR